MKFFNLLFFNLHAIASTMKQLTILLLFIFSVSLKQKEKTWVAVGDSITYLNDHPNETGNRVTKGYLTRVVEELPGIHYVNQGHNGWTAGRIADSIESLRIIKADIYSVFLGTNDWWHGRPLGKFSDYLNNAGNATVYGSFRIIINKLHSLNHDAKIILITPMQRVDFVYINNMKNNARGSYREKNGQFLEQFANAVDSIGKYEHCAVVDLYHEKELGAKHLVKFKRLKDPKTGSYKNYIYPDFIDIPFNPEKDEYPYPVEAIGMTYDGLHPSNRGDALIAKKLVKVMKKF
jgi:lysophospholipase L1-like esterase